MRQADSVPPAPIPVQPLNYASAWLYQVLPIQDRARRAIFATWACVTLEVLYAPVHWFEWFYPETDPIWEAPLTVVIYLLIGLVYSACYVVELVLYLMWQFRAHQNAHAMRPGELKYSPTWGIWYWFIPILNLVRPYQVIEEIDVATPPVGASANLLRVIGWWWLFWFVNFALGVLSVVLVFLDEETVAQVAQWGSSACWAAHLLLTIRIIRQISIGQSAASEGIPV